MQWHWVDLSIISIISLSVITGLFRGFIKEIISLCTWVLAFWVAFTYSQEVDHLLPAFVQDDTLGAIASFLMLFFGVLLLGGVFNALLGLIFKRIGLSFTDRILGMGFGFTRGVFIVALVILAVKMTSLPYQQYSHQSELFAKFDPIVNTMYRFMPDLIKKIKTLDPDGDLQDLIHVEPKHAKITDTIYSS